MDTDTTRGSAQPHLFARILHFAAVLTAVCLLSGGTLSLLYVASADRIREQERRALQRSLDTVFGQVGNLRTLLEDTLWVADRPGGGVRYVARGVARGYQSDIAVLVSVDARAHQTPVPSDAAIYRLVVLSSAETPGLGENINLVRRTVSLWQALMGQRAEPGRPWFQTQFEGKDLDSLRISTGTGGIEPVTGATETSQAATEAARRALQTVVEETERLFR